jgi:2-phospho-L-lactate/phosphoenolpyruvate guanylyltransferase
VLTLAIVPVKSFDSAKQRLAGALAGGSRRSLAQAMFSDVLAALGRARNVDGVVVVTAEAAAESVARRAATVLHDDAQAGQSPAAAIGIRHALDAGRERVVLLPGDTPLIDPAELDELLARTAADRIAVGIVADRHGTGTNALVLTPPDAIAPSFGPGSLARHVAAAAAAGVSHRVERAPTLEHDVDTPDDLAALAAALEAGRGAARHTRAAIERLEYSGVPHPGVPLRQG